MVLVAALSMCFSTVAGMKVVAGGAQERPLTTGEGNDAETDVKHFQKLPEMDDSGRGKEEFELDRSPTRSFKEGTNSATANAPDGKKPVTPKIPEICLLCNGSEERMMVDGENWIPYVGSDYRLKEKQYENQEKGKKNQTEENLRKGGLPTDAAVPEVNDDEKTTEVTKLLTKPKRKDCECVKSRFQKFRENTWVQATAVVLGMALGATGAAVGTRYICKDITYDKAVQDQDAAGNVQYTKELDAAGEVQYIDGEVQYTEDILYQEETLMQGGADAGHMGYVAIGLVVLFGSFWFGSGLLFGENKTQLYIIRTLAAVACTLAMAGALCLLDNTNAFEDYGQLLLFQNKVDYVGNALTITGENEITGTVTENVNSASVLMSLAWVVFAIVLILGTVMLFGNKRCKGKGGIFF